MTNDSKPGQSADPLLRASRFLSLILRHKPEAAGITLDEHGWADVSALLQGISSRYPLTMAQLEEIVRTDDKQRYSFSENKSKIRANQGHSIPVDVGLVEREPPEILYHGTGQKYFSMVSRSVNVKSGRSPGSRTSGSPSSHAGSPQKPKGT